MGLLKDMFNACKKVAQDYKLKQCKAYLDKHQKSTSKSSK